MFAAGPPPPLWGASIGEKARASGFAAALRVGGIRGSHEPEKIPPIECQEQGHEPRGPVKLVVFDFDETLTVNTGLTFFPNGVRWRDRILKQEEAAMHSYLSILFSGPYPSGLPLPPRSHTARAGDRNSFAPEAFSACGGLRPEDDHDSEVDGASIDENESGGEGQGGGGDAEADAEDDEERGGREGDAEDEGRGGKGGARGEVEVDDKSGGGGDAEGEAEVDRGGSGGEGESDKEHDELMVYMLRLARLKDMLERLDGLKPSVRLAIMSFNTAGPRAILNTLHAVGLSQWFEAIWDPMVGAIPDNKTCGLHRGPDGTWWPIRCEDRFYLTDGSFYEVSGNHFPFAIPKVTWLRLATKDPAAFGLPADGSTRLEHVLLVDDQEENLRGFARTCRVFKDKRNFGGIGFHNDGDYDALINFVSSTSSNADSEHFPDAADNDGLELGGWSLSEDEDDPQGVSVVSESFNVAFSNTGLSESDIEAAISDVADAIAKVTAGSHYPDFADVSDDGSEREEGEISDSVMGHGEDSTSGDSDTSAEGHGDESEAANTDGDTDIVMAEVGQFDDADEDFPSLQSANPTTNSAADGGPTDK